MFAEDLALLKLFDLSPRRECTLDASIRVLPLVLSSPGSSHETSVSAANRRIHAVITKQSDSSNSFPATNRPPGERPENGSRPPLPWTPRNASSLAGLVPLLIHRDPVPPARRRRKSHDVWRYRPAVGGGRRRGDASIAPCLAGKHAADHLQGSAFSIGADSGSGCWPEIRAVRIPSRCPVRCSLVVREVISFNGLFRILRAPSVPVVATRVASPCDGGLKGWRCGIDSCLGT